MAGLNCQNYEAGEHVRYNGQDAVVISNNYSSRSITIEVNGERITVSRNALDDIFGINRKISNTPNPMIETLENDIEEGWNFIKFLKRLYRDSSDDEHTAHLDCRKILNREGVSSVDDLKENNNIKEYTIAANLERTSKTNKNYASNTIIWKAHNVVGDILYKGQLESQQYLA